MPDTDKLSALSWCLPLAVLSFPCPPAQQKCGSESTAVLSSSCPETKIALVYLPAVRLRGRKRAMVG